MIKSKKQMFIVIGAFILVMLLGTVTYAFFNYTRTGSANTIRTGRIAFNSTQGQAINLTNMFPIDVTNGIPNDATKVGSVTINVTGDTTYTDGIEYLVSAVNVQNTVGSGANAKQLPISIDVSVSSNTGNDPATTLGTADSDYFTNRGTSANTSIYKVIAGETITNNEELLVGYIKSGATGVDGNIVIKAYLDASKVAISDTYPEEETDTNNDGYLDGTTDTWVGDRIVFTTSEWNSLQANGVSFQIKVESNEGIWVDSPTPPPICRRATTLNFEECTNSSHCVANGNTLNEDMSFGNLGTYGENPVVGDAFDCDVNGDGNYTERFYYISNYYDTNTNTFDNTTATLLYYSNTYNGQASTDDSFYDSNSQNIHGPITALQHLPSTSQWSNIQLKNTSRKILACGNNTCSNGVFESTSGGAIENPFSYAGKAARLLTVQEVTQADCYSLSGLDAGFAHSLSSCEFFFEGTQYTSSSRHTYGIWLENPATSSSVYGIYVGNEQVIENNSSNYGYVGYGVRPAIDVPYSRIDY